MQPAGVGTLLSPGELILLAQVRLPCDSQICSKSLLYRARKETSHKKGSLFISQLSPSL